MRGASKPAPRMVRSASVMASSMRSGVIWSSAVRSETCEVTRDIHRLSSTFISPKNPWCRGEMREHLVLVVEAPAAGVQRGLVERRESDAIDPPDERKIDHVRERLAADAARFRRYGSAGHGGRIEIAEIDDRNLGTRPVDVLGRRIAPPGEADAGVARALLEHARVADDEQAGGVRQAPIGEHARALLGADAGVVAEHQAQQRQGVGLAAGHVASSDR